MPLYITIPALLIGYSTACIGTGIMFFRLLAARVDEMERISAGTILATAFILGQGILASIWLLLALGGWFSIRVVVILCFVFMVVGLYIGRRLFFGLEKQILSIWRELREDTWTWQSIAVLTILLCLAWITSIGRIFAGDAAAFYMALPKVIAASHRLVPLPGYEEYTNIGLQGELHYSVFMALNNPDAARLFVWPTILAGAIMLLAIGRQVGLGRRGQWIVLAMLFTSSAIIYLSGDGKVDLFAAPLGLAAYYWILHVHDRYKRLALWLTGFLSGFAIAAKFSYIPVMIPGLLLLLFWAFREDFLTTGQRKQTLLVFLIAGVQLAAGILISIAPQLIKNTVLYQNPIAPFGFGGMGWAKQLWFGVETTRRILLTYPFALTFGNYFGQYGNISPLVLAFLPLAIFLPKPRSMLASPLVAVIASASVGLLVWIGTQPSVLAPRYILATWLVFMLLPARAAEYVSQNDIRPRLLAAGIRISIIVTLITVGLYFYKQVFFPSNTIAYLIGKMDECERDGEYCKAMAVINRHARPGDRIYLAGYYRYWLRPDLLQCISGTDDSRSLGNILSISHEKSWLMLYQQGFQYLIADRSTHAALLDELQVESPPSWLRLDLLYEGKQVIAYQLEFNNPPTSQLKICRQIHPPAWDVVNR